MVRRWNHLKGDSLQGRRVLYVHLPMTPSALGRDSRRKTSKSKRRKRLRGIQTGRRCKRHRVKPGETLTSIASTHQTTVAALKRDNRNIAVLRPGMILVIREVQ